MTKLITVKGIGNITAAPDRIILNMHIKSEHPEYAKCIELDNTNITKFFEALKRCGFSERSVKTANFNISPKIHYEKQRSAESEFSKEVFDYWQCSRTLQIEFPLDCELLMNAMQSVANADISCKTEVKFTLADPSAVQDELLASAARNARAKAEILCSSLGEKLGKLQSINYNWSSHNWNSATDMENIFRQNNSSCGNFQRMAVPLLPIDIKVTDEAVFIWEIAG